MDDFPTNFKIETPFNSIHLVQERGRLELRGRDKSLQSAIDLRQPQRLIMANLEHLMSVLLFTPEPKRILMLGTAAGALLHFLRYHFPQSSITAVDIDAQLIRRLLELEILPPADEKLQYECVDAAAFIDNCDECYDLLLVDIFHGQQSPAWLLSTESIRRLYELLGDDGALAFNLLVESDHDFARFYRKLQAQFQQQSLSLPVGGLENRIVYALRNPAPARDMGANMEIAADLSARYDIDFMPILSLIYYSNPAGDGLI